MPYSDTTVIIPTLNEVETISAVVSRIQSACPEISILVVDDGSADGTREAILTLASRECSSGGLVSLLDRSATPCRGLTASVVDGIKAAATPFFVVMDGDLQHPPEILPLLISYVRDGRDLAIGIRTEKLEQLRAHRALMSALGNLLARVCLYFCHNTTRDPMSGLFAGSTRVKSLVVAHAHTFELQGYKVLFDILRMTPIELNILEVPFKFGIRTRGASKFSPTHIWCFLRSAGKAVLSRPRATES